ncbi:MAG: glucokinase [Xanthomonadales bacterium]|nr:glucokinase [Xanthomonadales bacterium]
MSRRKAREIVSVDIGGTHARFAIARIRPGKPTEIGEAVTLRTQDHASLVSAWEAFSRRTAKALPKAAAICIAAQVDSETIKLTNSPWIIRTRTLAEDLGVEDLVLLNDFGAMAWAVSQLKPDQFEHICGPDEPVPPEGVVTVVGPGTGLGVAILIRQDDRTLVVETEGGHLDYAPLDRLEASILDRLREKFLRVSTERVVSGPGLANIRDALAAIEGVAYQPISDADLWADAISGEDKLAKSALERFCLSYGAVAGDLALAHGASAVVLIGGLSQRIRDQLRSSEFATRFTAKGRFQNFMAKLPVRLAVHEQPGLLGAAAAFAAKAR